MYTFRPAPRRIAVAAALGWLWLSASFSPLAGDWKGLTVFPRQTDQPLRKNSSVVGYFSFDATVLRDWGNWVEVRHNERIGDSYVGCVKKADLVRATDAVEYFSNVARREPRSAWSRVNRAKAWQLVGKRENAMMDMDEAVRLSPDSSTYISRGLLKYDQQDYEGAIEDYGRAIWIDPKDSIAYGIRGLPKYILKDYEGAISDYNEAIRLDPDFAAAYNNRGNAKVAMKDYIGAVSDYDEVIRLDPRYYFAYNSRGWAKSNLKDYSSAINDFDNAIRLDPEFAEAYANRANAKHNLKDYHGAAKDYDKAIRIDSEYADVYANRGLVKTALKDYDGAVKDCNEALRLDPNQSDSYAIRGAVKTWLKDYHGAINDYEQCMRLNPKDANAYNDRGFIKHILHDYSGAVEDYSMAIQLEPVQPEARNNLALLYATATDETFRNAGKALAEAEAVLATEPDNGYAISSKACALALAGKYADAIPLEKQALSDDKYASDDNFDGGTHARDRIAAWEKETLWLQP